MSLTEWHIWWNWILETSHIIKAIETKGPLKTVSPLKSTSGHLFNRRWLPRVAVVFIAVVHWPFHRVVVVPSRPMRWITLKVIKDKFKLRIENKTQLYAFTHRTIKIAPRFLLPTSTASGLPACHPPRRILRYMLSYAIYYCLRARYRTLSMSIDRFILLYNTRVLNK